KMKHTIESEFASISLSPHQQKSPRTHCSANSVRKADTLLPSAVLAPPTKNRHFNRSRSPLPLSVLLSPNGRTVISTEADHVFCDRRSGEIRLSTTTISQSTPHSCLCPFSSTSRNRSCPSIANFSHQQPHGCPIHRAL